MKKPSTPPLPPAAQARAARKTKDPVEQNPHPVASASDRFQELGARAPGYGLQFRPGE